VHAVARCRLEFELGELQHKYSHKLSKEQANKAQWELRGEQRALLRLQPGTQ
jgi:hypothetical protein